MITLSLLYQDNRNWTGLHPSATAHNIEGRGSVVLRERHLGDDLPEAESAHNISDMINMYILHISNIFMYIIYKYI